MYDKRQPLNGSATYERLERGQDPEQCMKSCCAGCKNALRPTWLKVLTIATITCLVVLFVHNARVASKAADNEDKVAKLQQQVKTLIQQQADDAHQLDSINARFARDEKFMNKVDGKADSNTIAIEDNKEDIKANTAAIKAIVG
eukprot:TRINITY_DN66000_c6_g6_i1.p1 TRINITY_DN66000_c6_g6~~TRINITY_DN66000_c6_g6_i1.p1  ORF type:complete len:144 (-),score=50.21 TRINITY_DN66000_c6_g6_i1:104-535(-)